MNQIKVIKRDGRITQFNSEKIKTAISKAVYEVDKEYPEDKLIALVYEVVVRVYARNKKDIRVEDVQDIVEAVLDEKEPLVKKAYNDYRKERTDIRETESQIMKEYRDITFKEAVDSDAKRDNANVDGNTSMGMMLQYGSTGSKNFALKHILKKEHAEAHKKGDIHIHDLDFEAIGTLTCCQIDIQKLFKGGFSTGHGYLREPNDVISYAALAAIAVQANQNDQHGGQSIPNFDYGIAPGVLKTYNKAYKDNLAKVLDVKLDCSEIVINDIVAHLPWLISIEATQEDILAVTALLNKFFDQGKSTWIESRARRYALKETIRKTYQAMEAFIHNLNTMHSRAGAQVPFSSISFGTDTTPEGRLVVEQYLLALEAGLGNGETPIFPISIFKVKERINYNPGEINYDLFKLAMRVSAKRLFPNFDFLDAPFNLQYYKPGVPSSEVVYMGCRTRVMSSVFPESDGVAFGRGNDSFTSINLVRVGIKNGIALKLRELPDLEGFYKELDEKIDLVINQILERYEIQKKKKVKNFPFLMGQGIWMNSDKLDWNDTLEDVIKHGTLTVGFIGLAETLKALMGVHHGESLEAQKLGLEIIGHMRKRLDDAAKEHMLNFSLIATPAEGLSGRFVKMDRKLFGKIKGVTDREYYTNSFHVPVYYSINAFNKIEIEAPYHALCNAGHISYVELDGDASKNLEAFEMIIRKMKESGIGYGSVNHPVDRDPVCSYTGIIGDKCPKCGRLERDGIKFERIRRITGYLVGTMERWNDGKRAEEKDRTKHNL